MLQVQGTKSKKSVPPMKSLAKAPAKAETKTETKILKKEEGKFLVTLTMKPSSFLFEIMSRMKKIDECEAAIDKAVEKYDMSIGKFKNDRDVVKKASKDTIKKLLAEISDIRKQYQLNKEKLAE